MTNGPYDHSESYDPAVNGTSVLQVLVPIADSASLDIGFGLSVGCVALDLPGQNPSASAFITASAVGISDSAGNGVGGLGVSLIGLPAGPNPNNTTKDDVQTCPGNGGNAPPSTNNGSISGMATYRFHAMLASLSITDTPVGYTPPFGTAIPFTVTYNQREATQPPAFTYCNLGPRWNLEWLGYITDDPVNAKAAAGLGETGGGWVRALYSGVNAGVYEYSLIGRPGMQLRRSSTGPVQYSILYPDGSQEIYAQPDGSATAPRKVFLTQRIDPAGNATTITWDGRMRISKITDALSQVTTLTYGLAADPLKITRVTDPFGRFADFHYDGLGRLDQITDVIGIRSTFTYEENSAFISSLTTPYGATTFTHSESDHVRRVTATDPAGDTEVIEADDVSIPAIPESDPPSLIPKGMNILNAQLDTRNSFHWDKKQWKDAPNDYTKAHIYHWLMEADMQTTSGTLESEKPPLRSRTWYNYPNQPQSQIVSSIVTPSRIGRVIEGGTQLWSRDITSLGKVASETDPLGRYTQYQYSSDGLDLLEVLHREKGSLVALASMSYNGRHRPLSFTDPAGSTTHYVWNDFGQLTSFTNARSETTSFSYYSGDVSGQRSKSRLMMIDGALPGSDDTVAFEYDSYSDLAKVTNPDGYYLRFTHDALDRLGRVTYPDDTYTETAFQALDPQTWRDRLGRLTHFSYNSIRQLESVTDPLNRTVNYRWCRCGSLSQIIDPLQHATTWSRDIAGRVTRKQYADGSGIDYNYEPLSGRLQLTIDEKRQVKERSYNLDNTLARLSYSNAEHYTPNVAFTYDFDYPRLLQMLDGVGKTVYNYYPVISGAVGAGQIASVAGPLPDTTLTYIYDELGRNEGYAINGIGETRSFDSLGRLKTSVNPLGVFNYTYVGATNRIDTVAYPNRMVCRYNYYSLAGDFRLKDIIYTLPGNTQVSRHSYEYSVGGNVIRWTQVISQAGLNRSWRCGYDDADQLTSVTSLDPETLVALSSGQYAYTYDLAGNRLTETTDGVTINASFNVLNQLVSLTGSGVSALPEQTYEWDAEDRLIAINYVGTTHRSRISCDGYGRQVKLDELDGSTVQQSWRLVWDGVTLRQKNSDGVDGKKALFPRGVWDGVNRVYNETDHLNSIRVVRDSSGDLMACYDYDPFGNESRISGIYEATLGYTGQHFHAVSKLNVAVAREYEANSGRWLSRDPLGERPSINMYAYCVNNPIRYVDPLGLTSTCPEKPDCLRNNKNWNRENSWGEGAFHCGFEVYKEANPSPWPAQECAYDEMGKLVGPGHTFKACAGTPDDYADPKWDGTWSDLVNAFNHTFNDRGGPYNNFWMPILMSYSHAHPNNGYLEPYPIMFIPPGG